MHAAALSIHAVIPGATSQAAALGDDASAAQPVAEPERLWQLRRPGFGTVWPGGYSWLHYRGMLIDAGYWSTNPRSRLIEASPNVDAGDPGNELSLIWASSVRRRHLGKRKA
jgi:hypothetical protein